MRVPLLIRYPNRIRPHTDNILLSSIDISPTLLGLLGFSDAIPNTTDGENLAGYLLTGKGKKPASQWYMRISDGNTSMGLRGIRNDRYTFVMDRSAGSEGEVVLFDRKDDPFQMKNIARESPALVRELTATLKEWLAKYRDPWLIHLN